MQFSTELRQITEAFSSSMFDDLVNGDFDTVKSLKAMLGFADSETVKVERVYEQAFEHLKQHYRSEYIYKCMLYKKVILGTHSPKTAAMLPELKLGKSKVDAFIINGIATSYEIKSEYDNLGRIQKQLEDYSEFSDKVFVVGPESKAGHFKQNVHPSYGIKVLTKRGTFATIRDSADFNPTYTAEKALSLLTSKELRDITRTVKIDIDDVPNTLLFKVCRSLLGSMSKSELKSIVLNTLKRRGIAKNKILTRLPYELAGRASHVQLSKTKQEKIIKALSTSI